MAVVFLDFFESAKLDIQNKDVGEIDLRNSMSRAYYAFYHVALAYADSVSTPRVSDLGGGSTHLKLSDFYTAGNTTDKDLKLRRRSIGYILKQNHQARCKADYNISDVIGFQEAMAHLKSCEVQIHKVTELMDL